MPFLSPRNDTGVLESYTQIECVSLAFQGGYMFVKGTAEKTGDSPRIDDLRNAIHANRVSFPVPVPIFPSQFRPDIQWRLVELYFIRGWSSRRLAERYGVTARRIQQSLQHWAGHAVERGYLQVIPPETALPMPVRTWTTASVPLMQESPLFSPIPTVTPDFAAQPPA